MRKFDKELSPSNLETEGIFALEVGIRLHEGSQLIWQFSFSKKKQKTPNSKNLETAQFH